MAKRYSTGHRKKLTLGGAIRGDFLNIEEVKAHCGYFLLLFFLVVVMINRGHAVNTRIEIIHQLKTQVEDYKSRNAYAQSRLIKIKLESELSKEMEKDSLMTLEMHPVKILIKIDSTHGTRK